METTTKQSLTLCMLDNISYFSCFLLSFFQKLLKHLFKNTIRVSNGFNQDQNRCSVSPDLGPNCLQGLSADDKSCQLQRKSLVGNTRTICSKG